MATPEEIQKLLKDLDRVYKDLGTKNPFANFDASKVSDASSAVQILNSGLRDAKRELDDINGDLNETIIGFKKTVDEIKNTNSGLSLANKTFSGLSDLTRKLKSDQAGINELSGKELKNIQSQAKEKREDLKVSKDLLTSRIAELKELEKKEPLNAKQKKELTESISASKAVKNELREQDTLSTLINGKLNQRIAQETRIEKLLGLGGAAVAGTKAALDKLGFGGLANALGLDEVQEKMRKVADEIEKSEGYTGGFSDKMKVLKAGISEAGIQFKQSLKDPAAIATLLIKEMISALQGADKATGELAKSFGTSYSEASSLRNELNTVANLSGDVNVNTAALQKSLVAINKEFGTASKLNGELLKDFTQLTTVAGYTEEAALGLSKITAATGTDLSDNTEAILGEAAALNAVNRLALNEKEIVEEVAKASAATTLTLGMQPKELTKAVVQAKALGVTLEQVESISQSLLNFESSISAELEAELLTGKNLNLEKARLAALNGDIATVAEEIAKQTGSAADFTKMNVIQQEALAKSVGMTREDLAKSLIEREALANIGAKDAEEAKKRFDLLVKNYGYEEATKRLGDEKYAQQLRSQSVQERFNASVEKLREIFISIAEPVLQIVSPFMDLATKILPLVNIALFPIINGIKVVSDLILYVVDSVKALAGALTGSNKELTLMQGIVGGIAAAYLTYQGILIATNVYQGIAAAISERKALAENASLVAIGAQKIAEAAGMGLKAASAVLSGTKAIAEVTAAEAISFGLVTLAIVGGLASVVSAMNSKKVGDVMSPANGKTQISTKEGALLELSKNDDILAAPGLLDKKPTISQTSQQSSQPQPQIDLSPLMERINVLIDAVKAGGNVYLDATKVGTAMSVGTYKVQ